MKKTVVGQDHRLWQYYRQTYFQLPETQIPGQNFALVTGCNPASEVLPPEQNAQRMMALRHCVESAGCRYTEVVAGDCQFAHVEATLAIVCSRVQAVSWCQQFQQNAYYYVQDGLLYLEPVNMPDFSQECLGPFSQWLIGGSDSTDPAQTGPRE